ncbi:MAG TPA: CpaF family protein [Polyangiaceae bacterium]|nr:CpaF family protein [Polyangiaceae bacterium]
MRLYDTPGVQPIKHLLLDPDISEIMINGPSRLFIEKQGMMQALSPIFRSAQQIDLLVENLVAHTGRAVTAKTPFVDFRLPDGSRVNVVIPPIALDGPFVTIRKATRALQSVEDLVQNGTLSKRMAYFLYVAVSSRLNVLFSGGTATGKTTLLGLLSAYIPEGERIVVIEDTAELELRQAHVVRMECRPPNMEGSGAVTLTDLLKNSLRMRPTRIILGEIRSDEAFEMLNAMSSGHEGCLAVLHASSPMHAVSRLEMMVLTRGLPFPMWAIQRQIASAVHLIVQCALLRDGTRRVTHISEVAGIQNDQVQLNDIYQFDETFSCTGTRPRFFDKLVRTAGADTVATLLEPGTD